MNKRYCVYIEWNYRGNEEDRFERCFIYPSNPDYEEMNGANMVGGSGYDGYEFNIYDSLEEAIVNAKFNPKYISYSSMKDKELREKDIILDKYEWNQTKGLVKKV